MQDALQPSPEVASVVSFINMKLKWPVKKEISAKQIGKNTFLLSINPSWKYTVGMGQDVENIPGVDKAKLDLIADRFESKEEFLKFIDEFKDHPDYADLMKKFSDKPELVDTWKLVSKHNSISNDITWLNKIDDWINKGASRSDITKLVDELGENSVLKSAFEADEIVFDAWKRVEDGIPTLKTGQPTTYIPYMKKMSQYMKEGALDTSETVKWFRVQGGSGTKQSWNQVLIDEAGEVDFVNTNGQFNFSSKTFEHAEYFQSIRPGAKIYSWEVPKWFDDFMKENAVPQWGSPKNLFNQRGIAPQIADPKQIGHAFTFNGELDNYWYPMLKDIIVPNSGKIID